ncbi:MAG: hypothetical protein FJW32_17265 [Acidobacteria bacterium]|nr:hypothetical protein [Acidobacteriota bacterium]
MLVVAGAPGSGKSTAFPVAGFGVDFFNADDRASELNGGSYVSIPQAVRTQVNREFEAFVVGHIGAKPSFAFETTLRSAITFEQARLAQAAGFAVEMRYLALDGFEQNLSRVKSRADKGGHSASESVLRAIYEASLRNLRRAISEIPWVRVYDNSAWHKTPELVLESISGQIVFQKLPPPAWLRLP